MEFSYSTRRRLHATTSTCLLTIGWGMSEERRLVTVLFADLVGFTGRSEAADPESMREIQRAYFAAVAAEVERYGGGVEKYIGDAVMALFGVPHAHDDDAERALHASLRLRDAVRGLGYELEVRIGVNTGEVVGGLGSGPSAGDYTVTGDAVNVAARLQQAASPGEIFVGPITARLAGEAFELEPMPGPLELKGKTEAVEALRLVRERPQRLRLRGGQLPLVGRARELASVHAALAEAEAGRGLLVAIVGEAGIGKSRLALEVRRHAEEQGFATVWATARSYADAFPFHLLSQVVEELLAPREGLGTVEALVARGVTADTESLELWAGLLNEILGDLSDDEELRGLTPSARHHALVRATTNLLTAHAVRQPLLLVLDDLQWTDAASLAILDELVDPVPGLPVLVVALYRPGWTHAWAAKTFYQQVNLAALRPEETRALAQEVLSDLAPGEPSDEVLDRSGGNPFFLEELLKTEVTAGHDAIPRRRLPETVHEVVLARIDALPAEARLVLQLASVAGIEFTEPMLTALEPDQQLDEALRTLQRQDLVVVRSREPERWFAFRHQLIHEVAYRSLLLARRRELHRRIASWLEAQDGDESLPAIASHYRDSNDVEKAGTYLSKAANRAASLNAAHEALRFYVEASGLFTDDPGHRAGLLEAAAGQAYLIAEMDQAISLTGSAIELYEAAGKTLRALDCRRLLGRYKWLAGRGEESEAEIERAIEGLERLTPSPELALAYSFRSQVRMLMPDYRAGEAWARKAIEMAERTGAMAAQVHAYNNLGVSLIGLGDPTGPDYIRRSLELALDHNMPDDAVRAYVNLGSQGYAMTFLPYAEMEELFHDAIGYSERMIPGGTWYLWLHNTLGEFLFFTGRWDDAERAFSSVTQLARATTRYVLVDSKAFRALMASHRGNYEQASELVRPEIDAATRMGDLQAVAPVLLALAHLEAGLHDGREAIRAIRQLFDLRGETAESDLTAWIVFEATDIIGWLSTAAPTVAADAMADVVAFADRVAPDIARGGTPAELAARRALYGAAREQLRRLAGRLGVPGPADEIDAGISPTTEEAIAQFDEVRRTFDAARARLWLAEAGNASWLPAADAAFEGLGAAPYLARARHDASSVALAPNR
jgi:class 3 adenylate cyclase/tetratricopeptide (TPR) repeat protein